MSNTHTVEKFQASRHEFDYMMPSTTSRINIKAVTNNDLKAAWKLANHEIPGKIADICAIEEVIAHNADSALLICRDGKMVGIWAMLMLSAAGLEELLIGELKATQPDKQSLAPKGVAPMAIYFWAAVAPGLSAGGVMHVSQFLRQPLYRHANCFSRPNTRAGERFNIGMGFKPINCGLSGLHRYVRLANRVEDLQQAA